VIRSIILLNLECPLVAFALIVAFAVHGLASGWFRKVERGFATLACRRAFSVVNGILALALQAAPLSKVVWARDMGEPQNLELIRYFKDRKL
jgi:hypothetical protein